LSSTQTKAEGLDVPTAGIFLPLLDPARYLVAHGGRGSGKSWFFAALLIERTWDSDLRAVCVREYQSSIRDSVRQLLIDNIQSLGLGHYYEITDTEIRGKYGSKIIFKGMQSYNSESIKSLAEYDVAWVEEAQNLSQRSLSILRPTIRKEQSQLWFSYNPTDENDAVDKFFRGKNPPKDLIIVEANHSDNPWFPAVLRQEMLEDRVRSPALASHVWEGDYLGAPEGSYYGELLGQATADGRIGEMLHDPNLDVHVSFDLGNGPNMCAWFTQWVNQQIVAIDFIEGTDDSLREGWPWWARTLREKPYVYAAIILPHDARPAQRVTGKGDEQALRDLNFDTLVVPKMNKNEAIKLVQRYLPRCLFDAERCKSGLKALKSFQPNYDDGLRIDRGPLHNWASHPSDAFRHAIQAYHKPREKMDKKRPSGHRKSGGWMK
jgi:phage terminase large subunit